MKKIILLFVGFTFLIQFSYSQKNIVSGSVTSKEDGLPIIGASVLEKGTTNGTVTNTEGVFSFPFSTGATLVFTYVGMEKKEVKLGSDKFMNVILSSSSVAIEEVVVTAMGVKQEKKKLNFAVQSLNADELTNGQSANFVNSLQGKVAGISVTNAGGSANAGSQIIIRSVSSINPSQSNEPLFIVDGMQISGGATKAGDINPNDIENVTILKGAAASALYGQEAANGVIMITTKSGKEGKVKVSVNSSLQIDNAIRVPEIQSMYAPGAAGFYKDQTSGGWGPLIQPGEKIYDNVGNFLKTGVYQKYDISASGGTNNFTGYASASYSDNKGVVPSDYLNKIGVLVKGTYSPNKKLTINMMANIINNSSRGFGASMSSIYDMPINYDMSNYINPDGSILWRYLTPTNKEKSPMNPYWSRYQDYGKNETTRNMMQGAINWKPIKNLEIIGRINYDQTNYSSISNTTPRFSKSDFTAEELLSVDLDYFGSFSYTQSKSQLFTASALATYKLDLTNDFALNFLAGTELKTTNSLESALGGRDFVIPGDFYSQQNLGEVINGADKDVYLFRTLKRNYGYYGELRFEYKGLAHLSVTGRNDHSSTLDPDKNSYFYPSVTGGAILSELLHLATDELSYLKIRGNWAKVGKDARPYLVSERKHPIFFNNLIDPK